MATERARTGRPHPSTVAFRRGLGAREVWGLLVAVLAGVGMAAQSRVNGELGRELDDAVLAAVISFGGGLVLLLLALALSRRMRAGLGRVRTALRSGGLRSWHLLGGFAGASYVLGQSATVAVIGVALFTVAVVAGQTVSGLVVDRFGLGPAGVRRVTWPRGVGAALMVVAVAASVGGGLAGAEPARVWALVLPVLAGVGMAVQQAFNGRVGAAAGSPLTAALVNFTAGTFALLLAWAVSLVAGGGLPDTLPREPVLYLGGLVGVVFIAAAAVLVSWIGVLLFGLASVAGQLLGSVVLDVVVPATAAGVGVTTLLGCGVALVAVVVASVGGRRAGGRALKESAP
ncbi:DMT family transporter [Saccharomonospora piscinae]|uniref:DMT family transporter n=1 Tax=Saccharomonospora piscinae TaxID=687388 RepID=UPI0009BDEED8|nr:DMT family transporter [Saccharomonospora piscinae]TLW93856.1 DMT family transporter [Saccharomonospora piscinae]